MRRAAVAFAVVSMMMAAVMSSPAPAGGVAGFGDVDTGRFFTEPVQWMVDNEITTGTSPTCFAPDEFVTRGQAAAFMWRMESFPAPGSAHPFDDVLAPWQQDPVSWMFNNAITTGTTATTYSPDDNLTRGQLAALLHRLEGSPAAPPPIQFPDVIKAWQITPVGWMLQEGITTGTSATTFSPDDTVTRGQLAAFFYRYKGSPAVVVDPDHPAIPACAAQVDGPATSGEMLIVEDTTLIQNHDGRIQITADNITLDCTGHTITGPGTAGGGFGINVLHSTGVTVKNCNIREFHGGIQLDNSDGNTLTANSVSDVNQGIFVKASDNNVITGNNVTNAGDWFGYGLFEGSDHNTLTDNSASAIGGVGFIVWASNDNTLTDNTAFNGFDIGLGANAGASNNVFSNNTSSGNTGWQIEDQTAGGGTSGTANAWAGNTCIGGGSDPSGLC